MRYYFTAVRVAIIKRQQIASVGKEVEKRDTSYCCWGGKMVQSLWGNSMEFPQNVLLELSDDPRLPR